MSILDLKKKIEMTYALRAANARTGLGAFMDSIVVPASPEPRLFGQIADQWQRELLAPKIAALEHVAGRNPDYTGPLRFMSILARGHNKTSLEAWLACGLTYNDNPRFVRGYVVAADRDQGRLILQAVADLMRLNRWMKDRIVLRRDVLSGPGGEVEVLPCDAASNMGLRGNFYIVDEFVHWRKQDVWTSVLSGLHKVTPTVCVALSNAGVLGSWQHQQYEDVLKDPQWSVFSRRGTLASWLNKQEIEKLKRRFPPSEADRLFENVWVDPSSEYGYLTREDVARCVERAARRCLSIRLRRAAGVSNYVAAIDYGPRRDRTVLVILHAEWDGSIVVDRMDVWQGNRLNPVQVEAVEDWCWMVAKQFDPVAWVVDGYQMEGTIQKMQARGLPVEPWNPRGGKGNTELAGTLRSLVCEGRLLWYEGAGNLLVKKDDGTKHVETFADELVALRVKNTSYGWRFDHTNDMHDDRAVAVGMGAVKALQFLPPRDTNPGRPVTIEGRPDGVMERGET